MLSGLMKDSAKVFAMLLLLLPVNSFSLGLGEINLHSALNQPLDAEIGLLSVGSTEIEDIVVKMASQEAFDKAGLERPFFLTKLKFKVAKRVNGDTYLKITSREPVKEPFLDFIVEANWPSGRVLREYTLLLDPPVLVDERPAALDIPLFEEGAVEESDLSTSGDTMDSAASSVAPVVRDIPRFTPRTSTVSVADSGEISYGPVKRTDTLWSISSEMRPDKSVTVQQVMIALLNENPEAFDNQNINDLKAGYFLRISDPAIISSVSPGEAERIAKLQYEQWVDAKHNSALAAGQRPLGAKRGGTGSNPAVDVAASRLKLVAPDDGVSQSGSGSKLAASDGDVRQELAFALESADVSRQENEELRKRLSALEEQLSSMQRLITLKGDTLSAMQVGAETVAEAVPNDMVVLPGDAELSNEAPVTSAVEESDNLQVAPPPKVTVSPVVAPPIPAVESSILDDALSIIDGVVAGVDPVIAIGGLVLVGLVVGALAIRRRKMAAFEEELSEIDYSATSGDETAAVDGNVSDEAVESVLNDVIPDYSSSGGMDVSDDDEIDAIAEADVYLAYRRFDKAEELLSEAVQNEPGRHDIQVKLLEVYSVSDKKDEFIERAESLRTSLGGTDNDIWPKVVEMGKKVAPTSVLFNDEVDAVMDSAGVSDELDIDLPDLAGDLDLGDLGDLGDLDLSGSDTSAEASPANESDNPFSDVSSDELGGLDLDSLDDADLSDALGDLGDLESSLDSAMDMVDNDSQKKEEITPDDVAAEETFDNEFKLDTVVEADDVPDLSNELSFEEGVSEVTTEAVSGDDVLEFTTDEASIEEPAAVEPLENEEAAVDSLSIDDTVSDAGDEPSVTDDLEFEAGLEPSNVDSGSDDLVLDDELSLDLDVENKAEKGEAVVEPIIESGSDVEDDLFSGLDEADSVEAAPAEAASGESGTDGLADDDDWLSDFSDEVSSLDDDLGDIDDSELFSAEDEVGTKLDLARAYIDMGDNESAKGILDEVVNDGNDEQKKDANELIERIK